MEQLNIYNIENTAELITSSGKGNRTMRIVLIALSVVAVLAIAIVGYKMIGDKRYNEQIEIADKAFIEGDYETAEAEYQKAVNMKPRETKAREGLAYTYAIEEKIEESIKEYEKLYEDTEEEKYIRASEEVADGKMPTDPDIVPAGMEPINRTITISDQEPESNEETGENADSRKYTDNQLCEMAAEYYYRQTGYRPPISEVDHESGDIVTIHLYEVKDGHTATSDWYNIDRKTAKGTNTLGETIDLTVVLN